MERAKAEVVKHYRKVYVDHELAQETGYSEVFKLVMPPALLAHSYASASTATDVLMKMLYPCTGRSRCGNPWVWG